MTFIIVALLALAAGAAESPDRDANFNVERQVVEAARYLYRIEADDAGATFRLQALLAQSRNEEVLTQARFLLGRIHDDGGRPDSALSEYKQALSGKGLQASEKLWLYRRLLSLSPSSIEPMSLDGPARSGPSRVFRARSGKRTVYALEFRGSPDGQWERPKEMGLQNENGDYVPLDFRLAGREEILDADGKQCLAFDAEGGKALLYPLQGGPPIEADVGERIDAGALIPGEPGDFVLIGSGKLRHYHGVRRGEGHGAEAPAWEAPLDQKGCAWIPRPDADHQGFLQCGEKDLWSVDLRKKTLKPLAGLIEKPLVISTQGDFLALKYLDRMEIRQGPEFASAKWGLPSPIQEKLILGEGRVYFVTPKGVVRAYQIENGQLEWQKDLLASQVTPFGDELFVTTFAQTCLAVDRKGRTQWTYEFGWNHEPSLLPSEEWLVLHYSDGKRVKLNRELLRVTGNSDAFKFMGYNARETEKDWKGALADLNRILALEPGNGQAWKLRSAALKNLGSSRQDQLQCLVQASRSSTTPNWSNGPALRGLASALSANWAWKRQYGPKFYPTLVPHKDFSFYVENDNQTLVLINHETGDLVNSFHFSEELDMKVGLWKNDTICVSSPSRIYMLSPQLNPGGMGQYPLKNPVCQAQAVAGGVVYSDWYGGLNLLGMPERTLRWEIKLGRNGLLIGKAKPTDYLDVLDLEGGYFAVSPASGKVLWSLKLPQGTITESFSNKDFIYAGYSQGTLVCIDRARQSIAWARDFGEQIFSLSGNKDNTLVLTTASKRLLCVQASTGTVQSEVKIQSYLFNRPTVTDHGYWIGTTEPALEKRNFNHELILKYKLPDLPGSPILFGPSVFIGTLDNFILSFPS
jgi:outer membrane protein assembly factor BamB